MQPATVHRIFLLLIIPFYSARLIAGTSSGNYKIAVTALAMGAMMNVLAFLFLGTDLAQVEGTPANTKKIFYRWLYSCLGIAVAAAIFLNPPATDRHEKLGLLALTAVAGFTLMLVLMAFLQKRAAVVNRVVDRKDIEGISKDDSFFRIVRYAAIADRFGIPEYSEKRKWMMTFATVALVVSPYFGFLAGMAMEHLTPIVKATQAALPVPKWLIAGAFTIPFFALLILPSLFFYYLLGLIMLENREKSSVQAELNAARNVQAGLMPTHDPEISGFDISAKCLPATEVGGDYYDYLWMNKGKSRLGIAVADVSGKAMKAAMTAVMTSGMIYREVGSNESPKTILRKINRPMYLKTDRRVFTAMCFAVLDTKKKQLSLSNAGQTFPVLLRKDVVEYLRVAGERLPLGVKEEVLYQEREIKLKKGDVVVFYTDGVTEAMNEKSELFGEERLEETLKRIYRGQSAKEIVSTLFKSLEDYAHGAKQHDDMTVVVVRVL